MVCFGLSHAQTTVNIVTTQPTKTMSSYLNGVARNHYRAFMVDQAGSNTNYQNVLETKFFKKLEFYKNIQDSFATTSKKLYRYGHNISDGNYNYDLLDGGVALAQPG
jgi:hypothetical protein